jgi:acetyl esterase/lipase
LIERGYNPARVAIVGDSAGGGLTLATLIKIRDRGLPLPNCSVVLSPFANLTCCLPSIDANNRSDDVLSAAMLRSAAEIYLQQTDPRTPFASPVFADFTGLPRLLITVDENECLHDDAMAVADKARQANVSVEVIQRSGLFHIWPVFVPYVSEARQDLKRILEFIKQDW